MSKTGTSLLTKTPVNRHRYGDLTEIVAPVVTSKAAGRNEIATGDLVYIPTASMTRITRTVGTAYPVSGEAEAVLASIADFFAGVAMDSSANGDSDDIVIATTGTFEFDIASGTLTVGMAANMTASQDEAGYCDGIQVASGVGITVAGVFNDSNRIGTIVSKGSSKETVLVNIKSKLMVGPAQETAA
jgi:hypothetical protein